MQSNYQVLNEISGLLILQPEECKNLTHSSVNYNPTHDLCVANKHHKQAAEKTYKVRNHPYKLFYYNPMFTTNVSNEIVVMFDVLYYLLKGRSFWKVLQVSRV